MARQIHPSSSQSVSQKSFATSIGKNVVHDVVNTERKVGSYHAVFIGSFGVGTSVIFFWWRFIALSAPMSLLPSNHKST